MNKYKPRTRPRRWKTWSEGDQGGPPVASQCIMSYIDRLEAYCDQLEEVLSEQVQTKD